MTVKQLTLLLITAASGLSAAASLQAWARQQPRASGTLLVLSKGDLTMSAVDPATLKVLGKVPSGPDPHEIVASSDGRMAYIANYNGGGNILTPVDLVAMKALPPIDLGPLAAPHGLAFAGDKLWFTAERAKAIGTYDPAQKKVDWVLGTGQNRTHMVYVWNDLSRIVTSNVSSATLTIIEKATAAGRGRGGAPQTDWDETIVAVGRGAEGFDVSPDGKTIWAANAQDGTISVVDVASKRVTDTLSANVPGANRLKFTPDGTRVFVSSLGGTDVTVLDAATKREAKRIKTGRGAAGIEMQPDGTRVYVACTPDDYVAVIDLKTLEVTGRIDAGRQPDGLAWAVRR
jgi:YVTN family beta-propeller protein